MVPCWKFQPRVRSTTRIVHALSGVDQDDLGRLVGPGHVVLKVGLKGDDVPPALVPGACACMADVAEEMMLRPGRERLHFEPRLGGIRAGAAAACSAGQYQENTIAAVRGITASWTRPPAADVARGNGMAGPQKPEASITSPLDVVPRAHQVFMLTCS